MAGLFGFLPAAGLSALAFAIGLHLPLAGIVLAAGSVSFPLLASRRGLGPALSAVGMAAALLAAWRLEFAALYLISVGSAAIFASAAARASGRLHRPLAFPLTAAWIFSTACLWAVLAIWAARLGLPVVSFFHAALFGSAAAPLPALLSLPHRWLALTALTQGFLCVAGYRLAKWIAPRFPSRPSPAADLPPLPPFAAWRPPELVVFVPIAAGLVWLIGRTWSLSPISRLSENLLWIAMGAYYLSGLSVFRFLWESSPFLLWLSFGASVAWPWLCAAVGVADVWLNFRARRTPPEHEDRSEA